MDMRIAPRGAKTVPALVPSAHHVEDYIVALKPRMASSILLWSLLALFIIFVIWASLTRLDRSIAAQGRVIPGAQLQVVSNLEGGVVANVPMKCLLCVRS